MLQWHFSALIPVVVFFSLVWFSSSRTIVWLSQSLVSAILFFILFIFTPFESEWFPKISKNLNLNLKLRRHSFSKVIFSWYELHFCFHVCNNFCSRLVLTSSISLYVQVQFHAKYPLIDSQSDCKFCFSYAILCNIHAISFQLSANRSLIKNKEKV